ncbi:MAG: helix-turn-helix domain-containing protein [Elusimicrobiaceae bacterium]|nr:helix-turn-helix domain-containing protein [Elusimicrobiaceae bacterium]
MEKEFYTIEEAAKLLSVSRKTIYNQIAAKKMKAQKRIGARRLYVPKSELLNFVEVW